MAIPIYDLDGEDLSGKKDPTGKFLFLEMNKALKNSDGAWVDYQWTKFGEKDPSPKTSWVEKCKPKGESTSWVVGSGTWTN